MALRWRLLFAIAPSLLQSSSTVSWDEAVERGPVGATLAMKLR
jgi:hypothetical protein